jgi:hypothetical protein
MSPRLGLTTGTGLLSVTGFGGEIFFTGFGFLKPVVQHFLHIERKIKLPANAQGIFSHCLIKINFIN